MRTSAAVEGFHVSHFAMLPGAALEAWALPWGVVEHSGLYPDQVGHVLIPLIPKADGGLRPIGALAALHRFCNAWERTHERTWFAAAKGRGAVDQVWRQALRAEAAASSREEYACVL